MADKESPAGSAPKSKRPVGAPREYDRRAVFQNLLYEMAKGDRCLEAIVEQDPGYPAISAIYDWKDEDTDEGRELEEIFLRAQELWCRAQVRKTIEIADDESRDYYYDSKGERRSDNTAVGRDRNRIMARQWAMAKLSRKVFGDNEFAGLSINGTGNQVQVNIIVAPKAQGSNESKDSKDSKATIDTRAMIDDSNAKNK